MKSFIAALLLCLWSGIAQADLPETTLTIGGHKLVAEVASNDAQRSTGLMHRRMLPENRGMLFIFQDVAMHGMWMMNTFVPLSVAFLDREGTIINIEDMQPQTQNSHTAAKPAKYALEMNLGWFAKRGIKPGAKVEGLEKAGAAR
ncbi:MAG: hypothetical protein JWO70_2310 [Betaproteobacteria bacterium]|nr:hypothetical protein [Betaproteobacteria bacterium]